MATQWNKYGATAARKHGKPGREVRPKATTTATPCPAATPPAAPLVKPLPDISPIPRAHFANAEAKGGACGIASCEWMSMVVLFGLPSRPGLPCLRAAVAPYL